jgi:glutathione synthase/RimK-type ligase-like ATP-grasp enzyme
LAIHNGHEGWNKLWIDYCRRHGVPYKAVNCYDSHVLLQIRECCGLMWNFRHFLRQDMLVAHKLLNAAEAQGLKVFPDFRTNWHYDDKLSQMYLFQALGVPTPKAWAFYDEPSALQFADSCALPLVAKLRHGAGGRHVRLLQTRRALRSYVKRMFGRGFFRRPAYLNDAQTRFKAAIHSEGLKGIGRRIIRAPRMIRNNLREQQNWERERQYVFFQEFIPNNAWDYRLMIVGERCWGFRRFVRPNDFRASGSHNWDVDHTRIPLEIVRTAFEIADRLDMQSVAFDFVMDRDGRPLVVEASYSYGYDPGDSEWFWDRELHWHAEPFAPWDATIEFFLARLNETD